ncbi:hypothetical protein [uncultured Brevundimonas sp.]|uniref:phage head spike fiber domain-containing protein n=1 Tax=uncultured Brevundimonas sp. TaxID=213418 RepID=UPI0025CC1CF6|nr:hypothetical protein [uncultured Brevundimonas sp.]
MRKLQAAAMANLENPLKAVEFTAQNTFDKSVRFIRSSAALLLEFDPHARSFTPDEPRLTPSGLLIEDESENLLLHSSNYAHPVWTRGSCRLEVDTGQKASEVMKLIIDPNQNDYLYQTVSVIPNRSYTFSFFARSSFDTSIFLAIRDEVNASFIDKDVVYKPQSKGFTRVVHTFDTPKTCDSIRVYPTRFNSSSAELYLQHLQLEVGRRPSSPIATGGSSVVRAQEAIKIVPPSGAIGCGLTVDGKILVKPIGRHKKEVVISRGINGYLKSVVFV